MKSRTPGSVHDDLPGPASAAEPGFPVPRRTIIGRIILLFAMLMAAIIGNVLYANFRESREETRRISEALAAKVVIASAILDSEVDKLKVVARVVEDQGQVFAHYLTYDMHNPITALIKTIASKYDIDVILFFDEDGNLLASNRSGLETPDPDLYTVLLGDRRKRTGMETVPSDIIARQVPNYPLKPGRSRAPCLKSVIHIMQDTGGIYGYIVLLNLLDNRRGLADRMAKFTDANVEIYDPDLLPVLSSFPRPEADFPASGSFEFQGESYVSQARVFLDDDKRPLGTLVVAMSLDSFRLLHQGHLWSMLLPFFLTGLISLFLFVLLRNRVFKRISQLIESLRRVSNREGNLNIRLHVPAEMTAGETLDELDCMAIDFNRMMDKLEDSYNQLAGAHRETERARNQLEERVRDRTVQLLAINDDLQKEMDAHQKAEEDRRRLEKIVIRAQKMEAIGALAGGVAHDLNNILTGVVMYPELALLKLPPDSELRPIMEKIKKSGNKAAAIVEDMLTLARRGVSNLEALNLNRIVADYLKSPEFALLMSHHGDIRVETRVHPDLLNIMGSQFHLARVLMNLVSNAAEAMPPGGTILIITENRQVSAPVGEYEELQAGDYATLSVIDDGEGISESDLERIFEPFYTKKKMGRSGTGLGMSVVWGTVKDHGGHIEAQSTPGKGTTFTLQFPAVRRPACQEAVPSVVEGFRGHGETVLVVDDVAEQREVATKILEEFGYCATTAASGEEAVERVRERAYDLLILDMIMDPGIDGLETYQRILEIRPGQKAIIVSGFSETGRVKEAQQLGAKTYIRKPYSLEKIGLAIRSELNRHVPQSCGSTAPGAGGVER